MDPLCSPTFLPATNPSQFCPFVQRVLLVLLEKEICFQYIEVNPYHKPQSLLDLNPRGLVPTLQSIVLDFDHYGRLIGIDVINSAAAVLPPALLEAAVGR